VIVPKRPRPLRSFKVDCVGYGNADNLLGRSPLQL